MDDAVACELRTGELLCRVHLPRELLDCLVVDYLSEYRELMGAGRGYLGEMTHASTGAPSGLRVVWCEDGVTVERRRLPPPPSEAAQAVCTATSLGPRCASRAGSDPATAT